MKYRLDKKSGNELSALGMGCMRLPGGMGRIDQNKTEEVIMEAIKKGVNFFDTAYLYPGSEVALGNVLDKNKVRDKVFISTKLPLFKCKQYEDFDTLFNEQLKRLKTGYIDYYFMHNFSKLSDWERLCNLNIEKWIAEKKSTGQIKQVGFSFHGVRGEFLKLINDYDWDFCMIQYNYVNTHYQAGIEGLHRANDRGITVFIMEPLLGGQLVKGLPQKASNILKEKSPNATLASWAFRWLWNQPEITMVLSGMNHVNQVKENVDLADEYGVGNMSPDELLIVDQVAKVFGESYKIPCTGCNYCLPCPKHINIPDSFMSYNTTYAISRFAGIQQYATTTGGFNTAYSLFDCIECGHCEKHCPQHIKIVSELKVVRKRMEPFWYRGIIGIVKKILVK
jgi:predicted aldo/keto reductase-like oxidoreductase